MEWGIRQIGWLLAIVGGGGLIGFATLLYKFAALQTTQTKCISDLKEDAMELKTQVKELVVMKRPMEVCGMKIDRATEKANEAVAKVEEHSVQNKQTNEKLSNLDGVVSEGFKQMTAGMAMIQAAFMDIRGEYGCNRKSIPGEDISLG